MNLKDFPRVIDTCTKMKEIIIFSELILDDENAALSLKENATQTISLLNVWVRRAATWTSLQQLEELLIFSERFIQPEVADTLQKAKAEDAQNAPGIYPAINKAATLVPPDTNENVIITFDGGINNPVGAVAILAAAEKLGSYPSSFSIGPMIDPMALAAAVPEPVLVFAAVLSSESMLSGSMEAA